MSRRQATAVCPMPAWWTWWLRITVAVSVLLALLVLSVVLFGKWPFRVRTVSLPELSRLSGIEFPAAATVVASRYQDNAPQSCLSAVLRLSGPDLAEWTAAILRAGDWESGPEYLAGVRGALQADPLLSQYQGVLLGKDLIAFTRQLPARFETYALGNGRYIIAVPEDGLILVTADRAPHGVSCSQGGSPEPI